MFFLWFISHIFFAFVLFFKKRLPFFVSLFVLVPMALLYLKKSPTYDLKFYFKYFVHVYEFLEYGFRYLILILNKILAANSFLIHIAYQFISIILIFITSKKLFYENSSSKTNFYYFVPVTVISVYTLFYFLGSQNAVRQYFAFIISFIGFIYLLNNKKLISLLLFLTSMTIHKMVVLYFPLYLLIKIFKNQRALIYLISFLGGLGLFTILITILSNNFIVQIYMNFHDNSQFQDSRSGVLKVVLISLSIFVTTIIFKSCKENQLENIKLLLKFRLTLFFYVLIFAINGIYELWGRIIFVFYFIDLLLISHIAFKNTTQKYRFSCALIILSYAIAPNAKNILSG